MIRIIIPYLLGLAILSSCVSMPEKYSALPPGVWRGALKLYDDPGETAAQDQTTFAKNYQELPFNFEVVYDSPDSFHIVLLNGEERIVVNDISFGIDRSTAKDTVVIPFPGFDTQLTAILDEAIMEGHWIVNYKNGYRIPFIAYHGYDHRFSTLKTPNSADYNGKWELMFDYDTKDPYPAIALLKQDGNSVTGTIKTETGDYRYLQGEVQGQKLKLSVFDGAHAFYFEAKMAKDGTLTGVFRSGKHYTSNWTGKRNDSIELGDPFKLTKVINKDYNWNRAFINLDNEQESIANENWNKADVKLVNIVGSWCPNCKDENKFLKEYLQKNEAKNISMTSISFERYKEVSKNISQIKNYKNSMDIPWRFLYGGTSSKSVASAAFPFLNKVISYPTLLIIDKKDNIRYIHTGFNGPATDVYSSFKTEFSFIIDELVKE